MAGETNVVVKNMGKLTQSDGTTTGAGYTSVGLDTLIAGERNTSSATASYLAVRQECNVTICDGTSAVPIGGGAAGDTHLMGILVLADAGGARTATIAGFTKKTDAGVEAAGSIVITGTTSVDVYVDFKGAINDQAALTVTASADEKVVVFWRAV